MKTIATSSNLDTMIKLLNDYWFTSNIKLIGGAGASYEVHNSKGQIEGVKVIKYGTGFKCISL